MAAPGEREKPIEVGSQVRDAAARAGAGDVDGALKALAPLFDAGEASVAARFVLAMTAWRMGRLDWSLELICACHDVAPMDGTIAEAMASLQAQVGNMVESIYAGKLATALGGESPVAEFVPAGFPAFDVAYQAIEERPLYSRAKLELAQGRLANAVEKARQHVAINSEDIEARGFYASTLLRASRASDTVDQLARLETEGCDSAALASLYARGLAAVGEFDSARKWHAEAQSLAPSNPTIASAALADGVWLEELAAVAIKGRAWADRFCPLPKQRAWREPANRVVIAYLVTRFADPADAAAVAAVARAHDRDRVRVIGYGSGAQSWEENGLLRGCFDAWQDVGTLDGATLARYITQDNVNLVIDAAGFEAPEGLHALARVTRAVRVSWLGNPAGILGPIYDTRIATSGGGDMDWCIEGGYPLPHPLGSPKRAQNSVPHFGADIILAQLCDGTVSLWSRILRAQPQAKLLLRIADTGRGNVDRLVARFGTELSARIDLVSVVRFEDFYSRLDIALAPWRGVSPRMAAEAIVCGVPTVALAQSTPYGPFLAAACPGMPLVADDADDYVRYAIALSRVPLTPADLAVGDAVSFARTLEQQARAVLTPVAAA